MTTPRTDWTGWTNQQLDTLVAVTRTQRRNTAERDVTTRAQELDNAYHAYTTAYDTWTDAVAVRDEHKEDNHA